MLSYRARWHLVKYAFNHNRLSWRFALARWAVAAVIVALMLSPEMR